MEKEDDIIAEENQENMSIINKLSRHVNNAKEKVIQWAADHPRTTKALLIGGSVLSIVGKFVLQNAESEVNGESVFNSTNIDEEMKADHKEPSIDEELLSKYPPGDPQKSKPNSYYADKYGYSYQESYKKAQKFGLMDENHKLTPTGEQYGEWDSNKDGYPYVRWKPGFGAMLSKEREKDQRIRREEYKEKHKSKS